VIEAYEKHWNTEDEETYQKLLTNGPTQCLGFRDSIQTNSVQTEVRFSQVKTFQVDSKSVCRLPSF
jgi:hypothetical protein